MTDGEYVERTFVALKPDAVKRGITGQIISRFEDAGFKVCGVKMVQATDQLLEQHYEEHVDKPFYDGLAEYMKDGPILAMVLEGVHAAENIRKIVGDTSAKMHTHPQSVASTDTCRWNMLMKKDGSTRTSFMLQRQNKKHRERSKSGSQKTNFMTTL